MRLIGILLFALIFIGCNSEKKIKEHNFSKVEIEVLLKDSIHMRAVDIYKDTLLGFGFNRGYGFINLNTNESTSIDFKETDSIEGRKNWVTEQRAVSFANASFFTMGVSTPARLRKFDLDSKEEEIVYKEDHESAFYNAMAFWNNKEGIVMGDPTDGCLSILITRDGGETWQKVSCGKLPKTFTGEAAFAASNGNIAIVGDKAWVVSGGMESRVFYSADKGETWEVFDTPIAEGKETTGIYSVDFYDKDHGIIFGGDYKNPSNNTANKAITKDGGKTWKLVSDGSGVGYKSCIRYIPNSGGKEMIAVGFTGISISNDFGESWKEVSKEGFYTLRFISDSTAIVAGKGRIAKLFLK